jgi:hypothetical protein
MHQKILKTALLMLPAVVLTRCAQNEWSDPIPRVSGSIDKISYVHGNASQPSYAHLVQTLNALSQQMRVDFYGTLSQLDGQVQIAQRPKGLTDFLNSLQPDQLVAVVQNGQVVASTDPAWQGRTLDFTDANGSSLLGQLIHALRDAKCQKGGMQGSGIASIAFTVDGAVTDPVTGLKIPRYYDALAYHSENVLGKKRVDGEKFFIFTAIPR